MNCLYCSSKTKVTNSRKRADGTQTWRRRTCTECQNIWTTHEYTDLSKSHTVQDAQKHLEPLSRDRVFVAIMNSLQHRKTALEDATYLTDTILSRIVALKTSQIRSADIRDICQDVLKKFDPTAAAVYSAKHSLD